SLPAPTGGLGSGPTLRLKVANGAAFGLLVSPRQAARPVDVPAPGGGSVSVQTRLDFGALAGGTWTRHTVGLPAGYMPAAGDSLSLQAADAATPSRRWAALRLDHATKGPGRLPLLLGRGDGDTWTFVPAGFDALDLTSALAQPGAAVSTQRLFAAGDSVWIGARVDRASPGDSGNLVARYDSVSGRVVESWCDARVGADSSDCTSPLDDSHPAVVPDASFTAAGGEVALASTNGAVNVYAHHQWTRLPAPGYRSGGSFSGPDEAWLGGGWAVGRWSTHQQAGPPVALPQPDPPPPPAAP